MAAAATVTPTPVASSDMTRPIEAVVFDMDGVLLDSEPLWRAAEREVFGRLGIEVTEEDLMRTMGVRIADVVQGWHRRQPWEGPSPAEVTEEIVDRVADTIEREGRLNDGAVNAIDYLRGLGLRLALASSSPMRLIRAVLAMDGLEDRFEVVLTAEEEARGKPDPAVYLTAADRLGVPPERCLAIEDSLAGIRAAKAAGMVCIAVPEHPPAEASEAGADLVLDSLTELDDRLWAATDSTPSLSATSEGREGR
jgi:mannitol-1-/sugar-/sorbitol-6-/2-deoxyglucose-6-phosphatase